MKRMSVMAVAVGLVFVSVGCGNFNPTGPSEAIASDMVKSAPGTEAPVILSLSPAQTTISVGEEVTVDAVVDSVVDLWGIATTILFDSSKLQFVRADEERLIAVQNPTAFMPAIAGDSTDKLVIGLASLGKVPGVTGYGTLFRVTFKAIGSGQANISFIETALFNSINEGDSKQRMNFESRSATITIR